MRTSNFSLQIITEPIVHGSAHKHLPMDSILVELTPTHNVIRYVSERSPLMFPDHHFSFTEHG
jgi:hypothetical protein